METELDNLESKLNIKENNVIRLKFRKNDLSLRINNHLII